MSASQSARERARVELTNEIKAVARNHLADAGAHGLSLRAVARDMGMVSSAIYRYFPSRDDLLTALIIDSYQALGDSVDQALTDTFTDAYRPRWFAICHATRAWAIKNPHEYALIFGSPIPGYRAPQDTVVPAIRVPLALLAVLRDARSAQDLDEPYIADDLDADLDAQLLPVVTAFAPELPTWLLARGILAWSQLFGMISFELFGQFVGSVEPAGAFFEHAVALTADFVGLRAKT